MKNKNPDIIIKYSFIRILSGSDLSKRRLPYMVIKHRNRGPTVWLTGCMHGDEIGGIVIIHEILKKLKTELISGEVYAFPLMNPMGFEMVSRNITLSKEDLNRSFPGNPKGTLAERIAYIIFEFIIGTNPSLVLDIHNDWNKSIPYIILDSKESLQNNDIFDRNIMFAKISSLITVEDTDIITNSMTFNLIKNNISALTLEMGESFIINEKNIENGVNAIWNILSHLKMVKTNEYDFKYNIPKVIKDKILKYSSLPLSTKSGIIKFLKNPGEIIYKGVKIARIYNAFGKNIETINSVNNGIILGHSDYAVTFPGAHIMAFGVFE